jgi:hypothetical protein
MPADELCLAGLTHSATARDLKATACRDQNAAQRKPQWGQIGRELLDCRTRWRRGRNSKPRDVSWGSHTKTQLISLSPVPQSRAELFDLVHRVGLDLGFVPLFGRPHDRCCDPGGNQCLEINLEFWELRRIGSPLRKRLFFGLSFSHLLLSARRRAHLL